MSLSIGDILDDRYVLLQRLGEGGQGEVWKALDRVPPNHNVALKLIDLERASPSGLERLRREAAVLHELSHPSLVPCRRAFEELSRKLFGLVLDYVEGSNVEDALADSRFTPESRRWVLAHLASVLGYLHGRDLVHRDLKPANVLLGAGFWQAPERPEHVKLIDLGIAAVDGNPRPMTDVGLVIGTAPFMAPEVIDPETFRAPFAGPTRDVFAFGVMGWMLLAGRHPTGLDEGDLRAYGLAYRAAIRGTTPWPQGSVPDAWGALLERCFALRAPERPPTGREIAEVVRGLRAAAPEVLGSAASSKSTSLGAPVPEALGAATSSKSTSLGAPVPEALGAATSSKSTSLGAPALEALGAATSSKSTSLGTPAPEVLGAATSSQSTSLGAPLIEALGSATSSKSTSLGVPALEAITPSVQIPSPPAAGTGHEKKGSPPAITYALAGALLALVGALVVPRFFKSEVPLASGATTSLPPRVELTSSEVATPAPTPSPAPAPAPEDASSPATTGTTSTTSTTSADPTVTSTGLGGPKTPADTPFGAACCAQTECAVSTGTLSTLHRWDSYASGGQCRCPVLTGAQLPGCCDGKPPKSAMWSLRLSNIIDSDPETKRQKNVLALYPNAQVCVKRAVNPKTAFKCTLLSETARISPAGVILGVQATTEELERDGIDVVMFEDNSQKTTVAQRTRAVPRDAIGLGTLCVGIVYRSFTSSVLVDPSAAFFLDPVR